MTLSYCLTLENELEPKNILHLLVEKNNFEWSVNSVVSKGLWANACLETDEYVIRDFRKEFNFTPVIDIVFRIDTSNFESGERKLIRAILMLLENVSGNAVVLFEYETLLLKRINNNLIFNEDMIDEYMKDELNLLGH